MNGTTTPRASEERLALRPGDGGGAHPGRLTLGRLGAGELSPAERAAVLAHVAGCARCRAVIDDDEAERLAFLARRPASALLAALEARRRTPWWRRVRPASWIGGLVAAAAALLLAVQTGDLSDSGGGGTRLKAAFDLSFHVRSGQTVEVGVPGASYRPGDAIQLRYSSPVDAYLIVLSVDSVGAATAFYDDHGRSLPIAAGVAELLDGSVILDDALGPERVIGCFSDAPLATADVLAAARAALSEASGDPRAVARLGAPCRQVSFLIDKRAPEGDTP